MERLLVTLDVDTAVEARALAGRLRGVAPAQVGRLAALIESAGLDGVIASPRAIAIIGRTCGQRFTVVTPGMRGAGDATRDQSRTLSAAECRGASQRS